MSRSKKIVSHPGETLIMNHMLPLGLSSEELATQIKVPVKVLNEILRYERLPNEFEIRGFCQVFKLTEDYWHNLNFDYAMYLERQRA